MFSSILESRIAPKLSSSYSFLHQEQDYYQFRPRWSNRFALAALQRIGVQYDERTDRWSGLNNRATPVIISIGSGAGSDAESFLQLGCIVYGVEPNAVFRELASRSLGSKYPGRFFSVNGDAHQLNLPISLKPDLIVCAQALHTFRSDILGFSSSESLARKSWEAILPDDNRNRISIWYYTLDPVLPAVADLDLHLREVSPSYANSKTAILYSPLFEPSEFQHYISADKMAVSTAQPVDHSHLNFENVKKWLKSFSFYPKNSAEEARVLTELSAWFERHKNKKDEIDLYYIGFITQGPLRATPFFQNQKNSFLLPPSPLTTVQRYMGENSHDFWPVDVLALHLRSQEKTQSKDLAVVDATSKSSIVATQPDPGEVCISNSASKKTSGLWGIAKTFTNIGSMLYLFADTAYEFLPLLLHTSELSHTPPPAKASKDQFFSANYPGLPSFSSRSQIGLAESTEPPQRQAVSIEPASLAENAQLALVFSPLIRSLLPLWFKPMALSEKDLKSFQGQQKLLQEYQKKFPVHSFYRAKRLGMLVDQFSDVLKLMQSTNILLTKALANKQILSSEKSSIMNSMKKIDNLLSKLTDSKLSHELRKIDRHESMKERRMDRRAKFHGTKKGLSHLGVFSQSKNNAFDFNPLQTSDLNTLTQFIKKT